MAEELNADEAILLKEFREVAADKYAKLVLIIRNGKVFRIFREQEKAVRPDFTEQRGR